MLLLLAAPSAFADLSVGWISREPKIPYVWASKNPTREGWPEVGQRVTWVAHVRNLTGAVQTGIEYRWRIDGTTVASGTVDLGVEGPTEIELPWSWTFTRHELVFEIDTTGRVPETEERNNRLRVFTDALAVGIWVERGFWDGMRPKLSSYQFGATNFDDWMQTRIRHYNTMAALARYAETPDGVYDRWRIDEIHVVDDGGLPVIPPGEDVRDWGASPESWSVLYPDSSDRTVDIQWGSPTVSLSFFTGGTPWTLLYDSMIHELGHARSLIDVYGWRLDNVNDRVEAPVPLSDAYGNYFSTDDYGLMNTQWGFIDRYSAVVLNRIAGQRAIEGNFNEPWNMGRYLNDLPSQNRLLLKTRDGTTFPGRTVRVYSSSSALILDWESHPYETHIDATPDLVLQADQNGAVLVGRNPFSDAGLTIWVDRCNVLAVVEVVDGQTSHWGFLESRTFNLAYWRGETELAEHTVLLDPPICVPPGVGSNSYTPAYEALVTTPEVKFEFLGLRGYSYEVWWSINEGPANHIDVAGPTRDRKLTVPVELPGDGRVAWWYVERKNDAPSCAPGRSATYYFELNTGRVGRRRAVTPP
jgi:hypothetical protein